MEKFNTLSIIEILLKNWKKLGIVAVVAIGISVLLSSPLIITPDYKSSFAVYPTNLIPFGRESSVEQLFQYFGSEEVKNNLTRRFNLFDHYKIDKNAKNAQSTFNSIYNSNMDIRFTRYQSVDGNVIDESPEFAKKLAEGLLEEVNAAVRLSKKEKYKEFVKLYSAQLTAKKNEIDSIETKLKFMRINYGFLNVQSQYKNVSKHSGKKELNESDKLLLANLKEHSGEYIILQSRFNIELENYKFLKQNYDKNMIDFNGNLSYITVVSPPSLPSKKNSPHRLFIVLVTLCSSLFFASIILVLKNKDQE